MFPRGGGGGGNNGGGGGGGGGGERSMSDKGKEHLEKCTAINQESDQMRLVWSRHDYRRVVTDSLGKLGWTVGGGTGLEGRSGDGNRETEKPAQ
ncbi:hypothetical protein E2C01_036386 [Portunus trituberculatus]|uniref:Uncharacterized protein n=1 Tax=Portunus trituberculatus TaxID=210409 RepID=A0A5B7FB80_PORTR|nr:hypothetical protein [Portunus trituberculatus]